ncbi:ABC transporter ATP-binding protein [Mycobacterium intermedium]|uniref:ABC transporter ATP-binding protein n=1 Tax=Mycobacterium intermedium TaxID=28445 RepID=A0A1E3S7I5_MYCIE|nr:FHA domain-containing protein [Mycobacterium intermedium]MCV6965329.1 ATP-binding cassette domain-containing protein [Mycobacterium intermedium]ODQ98118.1 ABC transporter ATP-binding protein [Mycobacterium intermedium]OPE47057.1 ABC transporter ATP-binding protein [Mycobacterium intermedium]ORA90607.1 ABC transporter ATP-binding protein [Mycobacterium intermedium]
MADETETVTTSPPLLEVRAAGRTWHATANRVWTLGRASEADIRLDNPRVSRDHAVLEATPAAWVLTNRSSNGMYVNGQRTERLTISRPVTVLLGSASSGQPVEFQPAGSGPARANTGEVTASGSPPPPPAETTGIRSPTAVHAIDQVAVTIGRAPDNAIVLNDLLVSRYHAALRRSGDRWELIDKNSSNGTYVNGNRITRAFIGPEDMVGIGHQLLRLSGDRLVEYVDTGDVSYEATDLHVETDKGRVLLAGIDFALPQRSLLAVVGPSGAGKSTLLGALTGFKPATSGTVRYDGRDLYDNYDELRHRIGFVPQDDILHTQLTVRRALNYAAQLRFPQDVSAAERNERIEEVLTELGLATQADQRIDSLSGGQRKRTSVALELLTKPSLLFLDEPTSGLDPGYEKSVMQTLRSLADDGRSVVVVTHNIAHLNMCDRLLILAPGGRMAYFGPPQQALSYFGCSDFADLFILLEQDRETDWSGRFNTSPLRAAFIPEPGGRKLPGALPASKATAQQSAFAQFAILCRRYWAVIAADRQYGVFLLALPLLLSLFAYAVPGNAGLSLAKAIEERSTQPSQLLVLLVIGGALMGCASSIREIVKERAIYQREHGIGLSGTAYLGSKLVVLGVLTSLQGLILGVLGTLFVPPPDSSALWPSSGEEIETIQQRLGSAEVAVAVIAVTVVSMIIGLLISAMIANADRGMPLLVLVVFAELVLCGGMFAVHGRIPLEQLAWLSPSRWAYAMGASTVGVNFLHPGAEDPLWEHGRTHWLTAFGMCVVQAVVLIALLAIRLRRIDAQRRARK